MPHSSSQPQIDLAEYLFRRLVQLGLGSVHGVPGDYNLTALDYLETVGLHWAGNANELNAGYAADGYGRIKGIAALVTSFGVGELSAINAIGSAYAEKSPVVHIVGTPPLTAQRAGACLHHSLGDGNFNIFAEMYKSITVAQADLVDAATAPQLIDATLKECILQSRPVYIQLPTDIVRAKVSAPAARIDLSIPGYNESIESHVINTLKTRLQNTKRPLILVDGLAARFNIKEELNELVQITNIPTLTTPFGKSIIDEHLPNFHGIFFGSAGDQSHKDWVDGADLVLRFGPLNSEINTFGFTAIPDARVTVSFDKHSVLLENDGHHVSHASISTKSLLAKLIKWFKATNLPTPETYPDNPNLPRRLLETIPPPDDNAAFDQISFWGHVSKFLKSGDVILTETGTAYSGGQSFVLPQNTILINSAIWLSIGYTLAACQGAALAQREQRQEGIRSPGRTILFEGDGSLQMSVQAISDIIRNRLDVIIFVINNSGYTVERLIHGFDANYNDIQPWRNLEAPKYFGAPIDDATYPVLTLHANNWGELGAILKRADVQQGKGLTMIEVVMAMADAPTSLLNIIEFVEKSNRGKA